MEVLGSDYSKPDNQNYQPGRQRRSSSRDRIPRRDSMENVYYDKSNEGDDVSIAVQ